MSPLAPATLALLLLWGTAVGVDLVSFPQAMIARPIVAGTITAAILGDLESGLRVALVMELFALDVLPVGAARYPDYGPATVAAVTFASGRPWEVALGPAVLLGLFIAMLGGLSLLWIRERNANAIQENTAGLAAGEAGTIARLQFGGLARDVSRSLVMTGMGLGVAVGVGARFPMLERFGMVTAVAVGAGLAAAAGGAIRSAGHGARVRWLAAGVGLGLLLSLLR
jgi:mannose/fructose/N-acetylgalactosamine-specific phosphotransferase system component IIC